MIELETIQMVMFLALFLAEARRIVKTALRAGVCVMELVTARAKVSIAAGRVLTVQEDRRQDRSTMPATEDAEVGRSESLRLPRR